MNNDQTPTKSDNVFVPSSPVFKHIKVRKKKGQPTCNDNDVSNGFLKIFFVNVT